MAKIIAIFTVERETKGAVRYQEIDVKGNILEMGDSKIGTIYVRKTAFNSPTFPQKITVTVE